jgi:DNA-binding transcriptional MerR regulator
LGDVGTRTVATVSARSYLSIGDVLTLLRQEFPDVTISKIRFLESQGLVNPERTPSGYRKFYEHDVERLRWVLRQQREHFLPLKVIKDRLGDDGDGSASVDPVARNASTADSGSPASATGAGAAARPGPEHDDGRRDSEPVLVGHRVSTEASLEAHDRRSDGERVTAVDDGPTLPGIESAHDPALAARNSKASMALSASATNAAAGTAAGGHRTAADHAAGPGATGTGPAGPPKRSRASTGARSAPVTRAGDAQPAAGNPAKKGGGGGASSSRGPVDAPPVVPDGASLSVDELAAASGLDATVVVELQEYGLIHSITVAGIEYFDEDAQAVATLAAQFARFGIEPRHLRLYKNAADREAGFMEQIVLPLVRQRNPEARARAHEQVDELAQLGQQLRGALLRGALKTLLDT